MDAFAQNTAMKRKLASMMPTNRALLNKLRDYRFPPL
jgi:hypothetical protein